LGLSGVANVRLADSGLNAKLPGRRVDANGIPAPTPLTPAIGDGALGVGAGPIVKYSQLIRVRIETVDVAEHQVFVSLVS
jgi:hypothetical protein